MNEIVQANAEVIADAAKAIVAIDNEKPDAGSSDAVEVAEIQADRDVAIAETQADAAVAIAEAQAEASAEDDEEWLQHQLNVFADGVKNSVLSAVMTIETTLQVILSKLDQMEQLMTTATAASVSTLSLEAAELTEPMEEAESAAEEDRAEAAEEKARRRYRFLE